MFDVFLDHVKKLLKSRLFPITLIYLVLFYIIIHELFVIQIVNGPTTTQETELRDTNIREIKSTRGNIYDRNGKLLATNALTYSVMMEDNSRIKSDEQRNAIILKLIKIIEGNGDTLDNKFYITQNKNGELEFTTDDKTTLTRFKEKVYTYVMKDGKLTDDQKNATAKEVYDFLRTGKEVYEASDSDKDIKKITSMFNISDQYSVEDTLKIMSVRYAFLCNYPKYLQITVASNVSDVTIAAVEENSAELIGVEVQQQTHRVYKDGIYFSNIIGYTGLISASELDQYNKASDYYNYTDIIGKAGLEKQFEAYLGGKKGTETVSVNGAGRVVDVEDRVDPVAGNDVYLTIDSDLQRMTYKLIEKELASILIQNITPELDYGSKGESANDIKIPIFEVYNALINNNIIDVDKLNDKNATDLEKQTYNKYQNRLKEVFEKIDNLLRMDNTTPTDESDDMSKYLDYFYTVLTENKIITTDKIPAGDTTLDDYKNSKISLSTLLQHALANNWIDLSKLGIGDEYYRTKELYLKLISYTKDLVKNDDKFNKMIYRDLVFSYNLSGSEICLLLFDQGVLEYNETEVNSLKSGSTSAYDFITGKIKSLVITPAMLALEPCSGSVVITDVKSGEVLALVSYPGYDNNKLADKIDTSYYNKIYNDLTKPMMNRPATQGIAPGSSFKMVTSFAALQEGLTTPDYQIYDEGEFTKINPAPKCNAYPHSHGSVNLSDALKVSCNYYFYEMGWRLSLDGSGKYNVDLGLSRLKEYATLFGLNEKSGIELNESSPNISTTDPVRSAIGQGSNQYTPVQLSRYITTLANKGTCYNLTLLDKAVDKNGIVIEQNEAKINHKLTGIKQSTWDSVFSGLYSVANEQGGSVYSYFKDLGVTVAGKTGTSQISKIHPNNALFLSFAPYQDPKISVTAIIPNGYTSHNTGELARNIYAYYFKIEDEKTLLDREIKATDTAIDSSFE